MPCLFTGRRTLEVRWLRRCIHSSVLSGTGLTTESCKSKAARAPGRWRFGGVGERGKRQQLRWANTWSLTRSPGLAHACQAMLPALEATVNQRACSSSVKTDTQERGLWPSQNRRGIDGVESWRGGTREEEAGKGRQSWIGGHRSGAVACWISARGKTSSVPIHKRAPRGVRS